MRIDAHQHFWVYDPAQYPWIPKGSPLHRNWLPEDLAPLQAPLGFEGSIAVQARQSLEETLWLLQLAECNPRIHGVVGWVDLRSDQLPATLANLARHPKLAGFRHVAQDEPDDGFLAREPFVRGVSQLAAFGFTYDLLIYPRQLPAAIELVRSLPEQPFVLDHLAKPRIREARIQPWKEQVSELARHPNVHCKISGLVTEADPENWRPADFLPYLETVLEVFGPDRLMFGSDWPVCLLAGSYSGVHQLASDFLQPRLSAAQLDAVFGANCARFYRRRLNH